MLQLKCRGLLLSCIILFRRRKSAIILSFLTFTPTSCQIVQILIATIFGIFHYRRLFMNFFVLNIFNQTVPTIKTFFLLLAALLFLRNFATFYSFTSLSLNLKFAQTFAEKVIFLVFIFILQIIHVIRKWTDSILMFITYNTVSAVLRSVISVIFTRIYRLNIYIFYIWLQIDVIFTFSAFYITNRIVIIIVILLIH